jgi:hypothetical protein
MGYCYIKSKLNGNVIDIREASTKPGALLGNYPQKSASQSDNQLWEFIPDPSGSGYYFIKSKLSGNVIDILGADPDANAVLDAYPQKTDNLDNQLWGFYPAANAPGYYFIKSALNGNAIDIRGSNKVAGALLDSFPQKSEDTDNQLWMPVGGTFPPPPSRIPSSISWLNLGGLKQESSGSTECGFNASLTINQDGTCRFWGSYKNVGDVPLITAPNQTWQVWIAVFDTAGKAYGFVTGGNTPSSPQPGSTTTWDKTQVIPAISQNWNSIVERHTFNYGYRNDVSFSAWFDAFFGSLSSLIGDAEDVATVLAFVS